MSTDKTPEEGLTAMQLLIEDVKANMNGSLVALNESGLSALDRRHYNATIIVAKDVIKKATELLEVEKQAMQEYAETYHKSKQDSLPEKSADEILRECGWVDDIPFDENVYIYYPTLINAMEIYRKQLPTPVKQD